MASGTIVLMTLGLTIITFVAICWATVHWVSWRAMFVVVTLIVLGAAISVRQYIHRPELAHPACRLPSQVGEIGSLCGFDKPEDLEWVRSRRIVVASEERQGGRLLAIDPTRLEAGPIVLWPHQDQVGVTIANPIGDPTCNVSPNPNDLYMHGASVVDNSSNGGAIRVAVVAHSKRETIQFFELNDTSTRLDWRGCIYYPENTTGNDVALLSDGSLYATNYAPTGAGEEGARYRLRGGLGFITGDVLAWSPSKGWSHVPNTEGALPNGIAVARDESEFYFADAGGSRIGIVRRTADGYSVTRVHVGGAPDNLSVNDEGHVLAAVMNFSGDLPILCSLGGRHCVSGYAVWEVDPRKLTARKIVGERGIVLRTATSALQVGDNILMGSMDDDRVGVYRQH